MRLWVDVYDNLDHKIGTAYGVTSATVTEVLDAVGTISLSFPASAQKTVELCQQERRVRIWTETDGQRQMLGSGVIREIPVDDSEAGAKFSATGPDALDALTRKNTFLGRSYDTVTITSVAADLTGLVAGWEIDVNESNSTVARFEGVSVFKALIRLAQENGLHLRAGTIPQQIELAALGEDNGITAVAPRTLTQEIRGRADIVLISKIRRVTKSSEVVNFVVPIGAGVDVDTALTLRNSTHNPPSFTGQHGNTIYYLSDTDSIEHYGQIEKTVQFKEITDADALYEAGTAWLERNAYPFSSYSVSVKKVEAPLRVGDQMRVAYKGYIETETDGIFTYLDVDQLFWIMKVQKMISESGITYNLEIATVDRTEGDQADIVVSAIEKAEALTIATNAPNSYHADTVDPTVNDDESDGYQVSWIWINTGTGRAFICIDNTPGAAVWRAISQNALTEAQRDAITGATAGQRIVNSDTYTLDGYDGQRWRQLSDIGWTPAAYPLVFSPDAAFTTALNLVANGGSIAIPILLNGHMLLESVSVRNTDTATARTWGWDLYYQSLNNGQAGEVNLTRVAACSANESFTPGGAASTRTLTAGSAPVYLGPGVYWLVIQSRHATSTFGVGSTAVSAAFALNSAQTKTTTNPNGDTLDFVAATWTKVTAMYAARLNGRVFGESTAF